MHLKNQNGSALPLVLVTMLVLSILGSTLLLLNTTETRQVAREEKRVQAYYIARSGAEAIAEYIIINPYEADELITEVSSTPTKLGKGEFTIKVSKSNEEIIIESIGKVDTVENKISLTLRETSTGYSKILWK